MLRKAHGGLFMANAGKGLLNLGLSKVVNILLVIFFDWPLGGITRIMRGHIISGILALTIAAPVFWVLDLITIITKEDLTYWA